MDRRLPIVIGESCVVCHVDRVPYVGTKFLLYLAQFGTNKASFFIDHLRRRRDANVRLSLAAV